MDLRPNSKLNIPNINNVPVIEGNIDLRPTPDKYTPRESRIYSGGSTPDILHQQEFESLPEGTYINPSNIENIKENVAQNQTMWQLTKNIADRTVVGEIIGGGLGTIGALQPSKLIGRWNGDKDAFEKNLFEQIGSQIQEDTNYRSPLFMTQEAQRGLAFTDASYWANMTPSVASTLSIMLPSMGISALAKFAGIGLKALGAGLELTKAGEITSGILADLGSAGKTFGALAKNPLSMEGIEAIAVARPISEVAKVARASMNAEQGFVESLWKAANESSKTNRMIGGWQSKIADVFIPAIASRTMDSSREAVGRYQQYYDEYKNVYKNDADGGEAKARQLAGEAAHKGFVESHANIIFDLAEWTILGGLGKQGDALESIGTSLVNKATRAKLGEQAASEMGIDIVNTGIKGFAKGFTKHNIPAYLKSAATEGFDETFMDFFMDDGKRRNDIQAGIKQDDGSNTMERLLQHHTIAKNWDSFVGGAMGGVAMAGVMDTYKGVKNKYFNDKGNAFNKEIAETIATRISETQKLYGEYNRARNDNQPAEASLLKAKIIAKVIGESYATGTTGLDIKTFENMGKLDDNQKSQLDVFKDAEGNVIKDSSLYNNEILQGLKDAKNIYDIEFSKTHHTDRDINTAIQHSNAYSKTMLTTLENDLRILNLAKQKNTNPQIEANRVSALQDLSALNGDSVNGLYEIISSYKTALKNLTNDNSGLDGARASQIDTLDSFSAKKQELETALAASTDANTTNRLKQRLHTLEQQRDMNNITLKYVEGRIAANETKLAANEATYKQQLEDFHKNNIIENKDEHHADVEKVFDDYTTANNGLSDNQSAIERTESLIQGIKDQYKPLNSKEAIQVFADKYNSDVKEVEDKIIDDFKDNISTVTTPEEIDEVIKTLPKNITSETIKRIGELRTTKINQINALNKRTTNVNVTPTAEATQVVPEVVDENNGISDHSLPTRGQEVVTNQNGAIVTTPTEPATTQTVTSSSVIIDDTSNVTFNDAEISNILEEANLQLSKTNDDIEFELARRLLLHLFNYNGVRYVVNNNIEDITNALATLVDTINKSFLVDNPTNAEEITNYRELIDHVFSADMQVYLPNVKSLIELAINQYITLQSLQNSMERSIEDFDNISTNEQKLISAKIIQGVYKIADNKTLNYIDAFTSKLDLFKELINLKKSITGLNSVYMSVEDGIRLLKEATIISGVSITDELLLEVAKSLPIIFQSLSNDIAQTRDNLIAEKLNFLEEQGIKPTDVDYQKLTYSTERDGKFIENISLVNDEDSNDEPLRFYNSLYNHIYFEKTTTREKGKITIVTKEYTSKYILNVLKNYNPSSSITTNIDIAFHNNLTEDSTIDHKINMINTALNLRTGDNVLLQNSNDGTGEIYIISKGKRIGVIQDTTKDFNNIKVSDNGKTYTGFSKIIPNIEKLFTSEETSVATEMGLPQKRFGSIQVLTQLQSNLLKSQANNLNDKTKNDAAKQYNTILNKILNSTDGSEYLIKQIVEKFILANNSSLDESYNITTKDIESVLKILFHNVNSSFLKDDSIVEFNYFKARVKAFDRNMEARYNAYNRYKTVIGNSTTPIAAKISKISKANILTKNIKNKLPLDQSIAQIVDENGNGEIPILFGTDKGVNSASGKFHVGVGSGLFTLVKNTNGQLTSVPLHSNTLGNHPNQANKYVANKIADAVKEFQKILNSNLDQATKDTQQQFIRLKLKDDIKDLIIYKSREGSENHDYFSSLEDNTTKNEIIKFITVDKGNITEHSIRITPNQVFYSKIDTADTNNLFKVKGGESSRRSEVMNFRESNVNNPNDEHFDYNSDNIDDLVNDLDTKNNKGVSNMIRHNGTTDGQFVLANKDIATNKYKDVVTGESYDTVHDYLMATNAVYAEIDNISTEDEHRNLSIATNVDVLGKGFNFDISLNNLDNIKEGLLETNLIDSISPDNLLSEVSHILDDMTTHLKEIYGDKILITNYGATTEQNIARAKTLITTEHIPGTTSPYEIRYTYFDRYMTTILNNKFRMNPIISLLHENIHAALFAASDFAKAATVINVGDSAEVIASKTAKLEQLKNTYNFVNSTANDITTSIKTQLDLIRNDEVQRIAFVQQFEGILENPNDIFNIVNQRLEDITKDTNKSIANLDKGETGSAAMSQEIFTYFTDPVMMLALSTIKQSEEGNYTAKHEKGFFATILSKLMDIYTRVLKLLGVNLNDNYTKQIGDLLNDTYIELMNIAHGVEESKFETKTPLETKVPIEVNEDINNIFKQNSELKNVGTQEQYVKYLDSIFPNSKVKNIVYHGSDSNFDVFNTDLAGMKTDEWAKTPGAYFSHNATIAGTYGKKVYAVVLNLQNPKIATRELYDGVKPSKHGITFYNPTTEVNKAIAENKDGAIVDTVEGFDENGETQYVVFKSEQIHILGSTQDIQGFKNFISKKTKPTISLNELLNEDIEDYSLEISDLNFVNSEIISIFANNNFNDNVVRNVDDIEETIC